MPSKDSESKAKGRLTKRWGRSKVKEAEVAYIATSNEAGTMPKTTISSKNQITLPARLLREMGLKAGDQVAVGIEEGSLVLHPRPQDWVSYTAGALKGVYGKTKADVDAYLEELRGEWGDVLEPREPEEER